MNAQSVVSCARAEGAARPKAPGHPLGTMSSMRFLVIASLLMLLVLFGFSDRVQAQDAGVSVPSQVEVVVIGSPHLRQMKAAERPATDGVLRKLQEFEPDLVVVEWLHPSIDPATTSNYRPLESRIDLARRWGYDPAELEPSTTRTRAQLTAAQAAALPTAAIRVELGKLHYLVGDPLNAGYQWWIADQAGADVASLKPLTKDNFEGHELEVWGFPIARDRGLEYLTPFDYQGDDAAWIWDEIVERMAFHLVAVKHGLKQGDSEWEATLGRYFAALQAEVAEGDPAWSREYGDISEAEEFLEVVSIWTTRRETRAQAADADGIAMMRRIQSPENTAEKRRMYDEVFPKISFEGLGQRLVDNWLRRNERMVDFVEQDVRRLAARKVLILVGEGHKPFLDAELRERGYRVASAQELLH